MPEALRFAYGGGVPGSGVNLIAAKLSESDSVALLPLPEKLYEEIIVCDISYRAATPPSSRT